MMKNRPPLPIALQNEDTERTILFKHHQHKGDEQALRITEMRSRFYLEDDSGEILVDPRKASFWDGGIGFFAPLARFYFPGTTIREKQILRNPKAGPGR